MIAPHLVSIINSDEFDDDMSTDTTRYINGWNREKEKLYVSYLEVSQREEHPPIWRLHWVCLWHNESWPNIWSYAQR